MGPQTGGMRPTAAMALQQLQNYQSTQQLLQYAAYTDPRTRMAQGLIARGITGSSGARASDWLNASREGQLVKDMSAVMAARGMLGGGNLANMAYGVQQTVANSGFTVGGLGGGTSFHGAGFATDMLSRQVLDRVRGHFFDPVTGLAKSNAGGMDMGQLGGLMNSMTKRGAFQGMNVADLTQYKNQGQIDADIQAALKNGDQRLADELRAIKPGQFAFKTNKGELDKMKRFMEDTADMLGDLKDTFGELPIDELLSTAESLVNMDISSVGGVQAMKSRIGRLQNTSRAFGLNERAVFEGQMRITQGAAAYMAQSMGGSVESHLRTASAFAPIALENALQNQMGYNAYTRQQRETGGSYVQKFTLDQRQALDAYGMSRILSEDPTLVEALYMSEKYNFSADQRSALGGLFGQFAKAGTAQERAQIYGRIGNLTEQASGIKSGSVLRAYGGDVNKLLNQMNYSTLEDFAANVLAPNEQARIIQNDIGRLDNIHNVSGRYFQGTKKDQAVELAQHMFGSFENTDISKVSEMAKNGDWKGMYEFFAANPEALPEGVTVDQMLHKWRSLGGYHGGQFMQDMLDKVSNDERMINRTTRSGRASMEFKKGLEYLVGTSLGNDRMSSEGILTGVMRGLLGSEEIGSASIMEYLMSTNNEDTKTFKVKDGYKGLDVDAAEAEQIAALVPGIEQALGVASGNYEGLAAALGTSKGMATFGHQLSATGGHSAVGAGGKSLTLTSTGAYDAARQGLEEMVSARAYSILSGNNVTPEELEKLAAMPEADRMAARLSRNDKIKGNFNKILGKINDSPAGEEMAALQAYWNEDRQGAMHLLDSAEAEKRKAASETKGKKADKLNAEADKIADLKTKLGQSGDNYMGVLRVVDGSEKQLDLFKQSQ